MDTLLTALKDAPIPTILAVAGIAFLLLSIAGPLVAMPRERQRRSMLIGGGLFVIACALYSLPPGDSLRHERSRYKGPPPMAPAPPRPNLTSHQLAVIDQILATLPSANIAFNTPPTLRLGHSAVIELFLSTQHSINLLQAMIRAAGEREGARIQASPWMEARLSGVGFKIEAITSEVQVLSEREITERKWEIEPTRVGRQYLHLTLTALLYVADDQVRRTVRTFERIIDVDEVVVSWPQRLASSLRITGSDYGLPSLFPLSDGE
jgi:hypothetical protein